MHAPKNTHTHIHTNTHTHTTYKHTLRYRERAAIIDSIFTRKHNTHARICITLTHKSGRKDKNENAATFTQHRKHNIQNLSRIPRDTPPNTHK